MERWVLKSLIGAAASNAIQQDAPLPWGWKPPLQWLYLVYWKTPCWWAVSGRKMAPCSASAS